MARASGDDAEDERMVGSQAGDSPRAAKSPRLGEELKPQVARKEKAPASSASSKKGEATGGGYRASGTTGKLSDVMDLLTIANAEVGVEAKAEQRQQQGYLERTVLVPLDVLLIEEGPEEAAAWNKERNQNRGKVIDASHVRVFAAAFRELATWPEAAADPTFRQALENYWKEVMQALPQTQLEEEIQAFEIFKPKVQIALRVRVGERDQGLPAYGRVVMRLKPGIQREAKPEIFQEAFFDFARAKGWKVQVGTPPRSKKERDLVATLEEAKRLLK